MTRCRTWQKCADAHGNLIQFILMPHAISEHRIDFTGIFYLDSRSKFQENFTCISNDTSYLYLLGWILPKQFMWKYYFCILWWILPVYLMTKFTSVSCDESYLYILWWCSQQIQGMSSLLLRLHLVQHKHPWGVRKMLVWQMSSAGIFVDLEIIK